VSELKETVPIPRPGSGVRENPEETGDGITKDSLQKYICRVGTPKEKEITEDVPCVHFWLTDHLCEDITGGR